MAAHPRTADGFSFVELLVVMLIIGLLAAIALPAFLGQGDKTKDASAKSDVRSAYSAMEACAADRQGRYVGCSVEELRKRAGGLPWSASPELGRVSVVGDPGADSFFLVAWSPTNMVFAIGRNQPAYGISGSAPGRRCSAASRFGGQAPVDDGGCPGGKVDIVSW